MPPEDNLNQPPRRPPSPQDPSIPKIRTFKSDAEIYMHENQVSRLEMATKNYVSQTATRWKLPSVNYKIYIYILGGVAILAAGGYFGFRMYSGSILKPPAKTAAHVAYPPFLQVEEETEVLYSKADGGSLTSAIKTILGRQFKYGSVNYLKIRSGDSQPYISSVEFVKAMQWEPPKTFLENLEPEFNVMIVYETPANSPVFILKIKNFSNSFAALLEWETGKEGQQRSLWQDLKPFIDLENVPSSALYRKTFEDDLIKNNDARAFRTPEGKLLLEYAMFSKKYIILSPSREALSLVLTRMIALPPQ